MKRILIVLAALAISSTAAAQDERERTWEFGVLLNNTSSEDLSGADDSSLDIDSATGWGFALNYHFNNRFSFGGEFTWGSPDYKASLIPDDGLGDPIDIDYELDVYTFALKGAFNFLEGPFTPYIEAGFGWTEIDSNVADQPPVTGCWWDPWWGYICDTFYSTYSKTQESIQYAAGLRYDFANGMTLKGSYGVMEVDTSKTTENASFENIRLELSWRF